MSKLKIGIVEDEMVIADTIALAIRKLGYDACFIAGNYHSAIAKIDKEKPDLILVDIILTGKKDGIDLAHYIRETYSMLIIFLTANSDMNTVQRAKTVQPNAYLVKPFSQSDLFASIEIAVSNHEAILNHTKESILVKDGHNFIKVFFKEIVYLQSDSNYVVIHCKGDRRIMVRSTITEMEKKLDAKFFFKINRGNILNINFITQIKTDHVFIDTLSFSILKPQREALIALIEK